MVGTSADREGRKTVDEYRRDIQNELETKDGKFAYNDKGDICVRRPVGKTAILLPIDLDHGIIDSDPSQTRSYKLKLKPLRALREEVGWEPPKRK